MGKAVYSGLTLVSIALLLLVGASSGADSGIWNDETVADTITQTNTDYGVCMGGTCYTSWQVSISNNASINNSEICTAANGVCGAGGGGESGWTNTSTDTTTTLNAVVNGNITVNADGSNPPTLCYSEAMMQDSLQEEEE